MVYKVFWVFTRHRFLVRNQRFGTICLFHLQMKSNKDAIPAVVTAAAQGVTGRWKPSDGTLMG
jgi:hypothetical protein